MIECDIILFSELLHNIFLMESLSSETGDNMPAHATDGTAMTNGKQEDAAKQSLVHGDIAQ